MAQRSETGSGKPDYAHAPRARITELDPLREVPYRPAAYNGRIRGRTYVSTRPRALDSFERFLFHQRGTRVGLIFFLSAAVPLNFFRVQNLTAVSPSGSPSVVTARLECIRMPQTVCDLRRPAFSRPLFMLLVIPIASEFSL